jgi:hypothetical protein
MLKKPVIELWAVPLKQYVKEGGIEASVSELSRLVDGKSQYKDISDLCGEFAPDHVFGGHVGFPFIIRDQGYMVLIPDFMKDEGRELFWRNMPGENIPVTRLKATKVGRKWLIEEEGRSG